MGQRPKSHASKVANLRRRPWAVSSLNALENILWILPCSHSSSILQLTAPSLLLDASSFFFHMPRIGELNHCLINSSYTSTSRIIAIVLTYVCLEYCQLQVTNLIFDTQCRSPSARHGRWLQKGFLIGRYFVCRILFPHTPAWLTQSLKGCATRKSIYYPFKFPLKWHCLYISFTVHERVPVCWLSYFGSVTTKFIPV